MERKKDDVLALGNEIVSEGLSRGIDDIEVYYQDVDSQEVVIEKNDLQLPKADKYKGIGVRVCKDMRIGFAATNDMETNSSKNLLDEALILAQNSPPDRNNVFPAKANLSEVKDIYDSEGAEIELNNLIEISKDFMTEIKKDDRVMVESASFSANIINNAIFTSKGISSQYQKTFFSAQALSFAREKELVSSFDIEYLASCFLQDLSIKKSAARLRDKVVASLGAEPVESFKGEILLTPFAAVSLIMRPIVFAINSENVQNGISPWKNKLTERVSSNKLTIHDDGTEAGGIGSKKFDREGVFPEKFTVIEKGILQELLYNSYTAHRAGRKSNGRAAGGAQSTPGISPGNLIVAPGKKSSKDLIKDIKKGLLVNRYSGSVDPVSGDFSGVVKGGELIVQGKRKQPVREVMISGNIYDILDQIIGISQNREDIMNYKLPYMLFSDISITGKDSLN